MLIASPALAQVKPCEELKSEIEAKIKANGVQAFTLEIVPNEQVKEGEGKVVGTCDAAPRRSSTSAALPRLRAIRNRSKVGAPGRLVG